MDNIERTLGQLFEGRDFEKVLNWLIMENLLF